MFFTVLAYTGTRIARSAPDPFDRLLAATITTGLLTQAILNIGAVLGVLPIIGTPLPFISYGNSSMVVSLFAAGLRAGIARRHPAIADLSRR